MNALTSYMPTWPSTSTATLVRYAQYEIDSAQAGTNVRAFNETRNGVALLAGAASDGEAFARAAGVCAAAAQCITGADVGSRAKRAGLLGNARGLMARAMADATLPEPLSRRNQIGIAYAMASGAIRSATSNGSALWAAQRMQQLATTQPPAVRAPGPVPPLGSQQIPYTPAPQQLLLPGPTANLPPDQQSQTQQPQPGETPQPPPPAYRQYIAPVGVGVGVLLLLLVVTRRRK